MVSSSPVSPITGECRKAPVFGAFRRSGVRRRSPVVPPWSFESVDQRLGDQYRYDGRAHKDGRQRGRKCAWVPRVGLRRETPYSDCPS
jgi:hypothetical protein